MLDEYRNKIDELDSKISALLNERLTVCKQIGIEKAKMDNNVLDKNRELVVLNKVTQNADENHKVYIKQIYETIFETSKAYQRQFIHKDSLVSTKIRNAIESGVKKFPVSATVACQGVEGAYSSIAATKMFEIPNILYFKSWEGVFDAVEKGLCDYGVLPIENSTAGSVSKVYDLMKHHNFYIVRAIKLKVQHCLLANSGTKISDIKEVVSHQQALDQCSDILAKLNVKITPCENTAMAAQIVKESKRGDIACISSRECASLYNLSILEQNIQNSSSNYTRFICISKNLEIFENSNKISIMASLPHEKGSLNRILNKFAAVGLNLTKLESRPMANTDFEFNFYFDFEASIENKEVISLIADLENGTEQFTFLGGYTEIK